MTDEERLEFLQNILNYIGNTESVKEQIREEIRELKKEIENPSDSKKMKYYNGRNYES